VEIISCVCCQRYFFVNIMPWLSCCCGQMWVILLTVVIRTFLSGQASFLFGRRHLRADATSHATGHQVNWSVSPKILSPRANRMNTVDPDMHSTAASPKA